MKNESSRNLQGEEHQDHSKIKFKHSTSRVEVDQLKQVQNKDCFLSKILCLHHLRIALRYVCDVNNDNIVKYNENYERFMTSTKLRDIAIEYNNKGQDFNMLNEAFKLQGFTIFLIILLSLMASAASVIVIYYQQTLAKYIITQTPDQQYKWFGIIVGCIVARFLIFNYLMALTNNVAINIKVGLQNMFMRAIFFLDRNQEELNMHRMRFLSTEALVQGIIFIPYAFISFCTVVGVVVLIFILDNQYGFIYFGIVLFVLILHIIILVFVYKRLKRNEQVKDQIVQQSKWVFRSLIPLIFDRISEKIVQRLIKIKNESLNADRFYNFLYSFSQFASDASTVVPIIIYYGINYNNPKGMPLQKTYLTAVYLGMLYFPFKIFVFGSYTIIRGFEQYFSMVQNFRKHLKERRIKDQHLVKLSDLEYHAYPDDLGDCFNYKYSEKKTQESEEQMPTEAQLKRSPSNTFLDLNPQEGETFMAYFNTNNKNQVERYIKELINTLPHDKTVAIINEDHFILPETFLENILFYSNYDEQRFHNILKLMELDYFIPQIQAFGNTRLNFRMAKYYEWHQCRLELCRALYNNVDYLLINKYIVVEDMQLLKTIIDHRKKEGKITFVANNWNMSAFSLADKVILFENERREIGTYSDLKIKQNSILNEIQKELKKEGVEIKKSQQIAILHDNFIALMNKKPKKLELSRSIYFKFFGFAHYGGAIVVMLALIAPISFKIYILWLQGQSIKMAIYPDIITFGVLYLFFIFLRGIILSFYFRQSSSQLFKKVVTKHQSLCGDQLLSIYKDKDDKIENDFRKLDSNLVICFELGFSVIVQSFGSLIIIALGQPIVLAMGLPLLIFSGIINVLYSRIQRKILVLKERYEQQLKSFVNHCTTRALTIYKYGQYQHIQERFNQMHRISIMFTCNEMWVLSGMRMMGQIIIIVGVIIFLIIMIQTQYKQTSNLAMVSYGVSLFINMNFSYRFSLKTFAVIDTQTLALTKCIDFFKEVEEQAQQQQKKDEQIVQIKEVETIEFKNVDIEFGHNQCSDIHLKLSKGDRVAVSSETKSLVTLPFYLLRRKLFSKDHLKGDIIINGVPNQNFNIDGLFYLHPRPLLSYDGTVYDVCEKWSEKISRDDCQRELNDFFKEINISQIFTIDSNLGTLNIGFQQILAVFRTVKFQKCKILIMISAFDYLDILTRIKVQKYLISQKSISILISITNNPEITHFYQRQITFKDKNFMQQPSQIKTIQRQISRQKKNME